MICFEVPDRLTTCRNKPNSPKSLFAANSGSVGCLVGTEMLMELDSELHQGADILSTTCTLTNLFLLAAHVKESSFS